MARRADEAVLAGTPYPSDTRGLELKEVTARIAIGLVYEPPPPLGWLAGSRMSKPSAQIYVCIHCLSVEPDSICVHPCR